MKKITLQELWEDYLPDIVSFTMDTDISKNTDQERPPEESCLKEILSNDVEIQYAVLSELAEQAAVHRHDPTTVCSFASNIFAGSQTDKADYEKKLRGIFKVVSHLYDAAKDEVVGWSVLHTNPQAVSQMLELQRDGKLDWSAAHFLPPDAESLQYTESAAYIAEYKGKTDADLLRQMQESTFYRSIKKAISKQKAAFFMANGFLPEELEDDPYIQTLFALGHKVYIPVYKEDNNLIVVVA